MPPSALCLALASFSLFFPPALRAQNLPYATSFFGNTWGQGSISNYGKWMQNNINGIWVKPDGTVYTASWWDEAGHNGGIYKNGDYIGKLNYNHDYFEGGVGITGDANYVYAGNWNNIYRFNFNGTVSTQVSTTTTSTTDKSKSVKGLSVDNTNNLLFVTQDLDNQVQVWNKSALTKTRSWSLAGPGACASNGDGTVWVAQPALGKIVHYDSNGNLLSQSITGAAGFDPQALCFDNSGRLVVADNGPDQNLKIYSNLNNATPTLAATFGTQKGIFSGTAGAVGPLKFSGLTGVGVDSSGNYYIGQNNVGKWAFWNGGGSILESYTSGGNRNWILQGLEFVDTASADPGSANGNLLDVYTKYNHYQLDLSQTKPGKEATLKGHTLNQFKYPQDQRYQRANDNFDYTGGTFVRTVGGKKILYVMDMQARRLLWYRFNSATDGEIAIPSGLLESNANYTATYPNSPTGGEFIWRDGNGNGQMDAGEYVSGPGTPNLAYGWWVDSNGDIWQCNNWNATVGLRHWKMQGLDANGNPIYSYVSGQYEALARPASTGGDLKRIIYQRATDVMLITSADTNVDRDAGTRIARFNSWSTGNRTAAWDISVPRATAITAEGDYIFVGYGNLGNNIESGSIDVYTLASGTFVGSIHAGPEVMNISGALDIPYGISVYKRSNGEYLIFEEDDWHAKVMMFRWQAPTLATDCLDDWTKVNSKTTGMTLDTNNSNAYFDGDTSRACRSSDTTQSLVYRSSNISSFTASVYAGINHADPATQGGIKFYTSPDGATWSLAGVVAANYGSNNGQWVCYNYVPSGALPGGTNYLKVEFNAASGVASWDPQLAQITLTSTGGFLTGSGGNSTIYNDTAPGFNVSGDTWNYSNNRNVGDYNNDVHYMMANNSYWNFSFNGTGADYITEKDSGSGNVDIYVDGVFKQRVNCYAPSRLVQQTVYSITGLAPGNHTIGGVKVDGTYNIVDAIKVYTTPAPPPATMVNDTSSAFTVSGDSWNYSYNRGVGDYSNDVHYMTVNGSYWDFTFNGTGVDYITEKDSGSGNVDIYVDGVFKQRVNCYSATLQAQQTVYSITGLSAGSHHIGAVKIDGLYNIVDAMKVYP
ncbi:MAG: hypothetical protein SFU85_03440 [Candidatus Methylacidiphilales bacterium]|nr:hypothetical protein [Candidatus Methylacidiphilales bacterium]